MPGHNILRILHGDHLQVASTQGHGKGPEVSQSRIEPLPVISSISPSGDDASRPLGPGRFIIKRRHSNHFTGLFVYNEPEGDVEVVLINLGRVELAGDIEQVLRKTLGAALVVNDAVVFARGVRYQGPPMLKMGAMINTSPVQLQHNCCSNTTDLAESTTNSGLHEKESDPNGRSMYETTRRYIKTSLESAGHALSFPILMGRGRSLTEAERGRISGLAEAGFRIKAIAKRTGRSRESVQRALKARPSRRRTRGRNPSLSRRQAHRIVRKAATGDYSSTRLEKKLSFACTARTIRRFLAEVDWMDYAKMGKTLPLTKQHKIARLDWAKRMIVQPDIWFQIIFSDEKKFNLDGPDGLRHYWREKRRPATQPVRRQNGGGSVIVWGGGGFSVDGKSKLAVLQGRQASEHYEYTVSEYILPFAHLHHGLDYMYQQDNASIHRSKLTTDSFEEEGVRVLDWPARSSGLNLSRTVGPWWLRSSTKTELSTIL
ncbi:hypothetical protein ON010_g13234 [Phytophthora cinnamomi]|nr:hypothetical protein ON010_g13234 [Phytophthora cinnamomi]